MRYTLSIPLVEKCLIMEFKKEVVQHSDDGIRLDKYFHRNVPGLSFLMVAKLVRKKDIMVNGVRADVGQRLRHGDVVQYPILLQERDNGVRIFPDRAISLLRDSIIYQDEYIIVINKPSGLATQGGSKVSISVDDMSQCLQEDTQGKPKLVHRLDKETSGILILARDANIASKISELIRARLLHKVYVAVCFGRPANLNGTISSDLVNKEGRAQTAVTTYQVLGSSADGYSVLKIVIVTGRMHQIRRHLSAVGCPIVGDSKYGEAQGKRLALHSYLASFNLLGSDYQLRAPLQQDFKEVLSKCGLHGSIEMVECLKFNS